MTTFYVSLSGDDNNNGTSLSTPWKSISKVNSVDFAPGDTILFQGGESFSGSLYFHPGQGGTKDNPISIGSFGNGKATISPSSDMDGFFAYNSACFHLSNLIFMGAGANATNRAGIHFYNDLEGNVKLEYAHIDQVEVSGFYVGLLLGGWNGASGYNDVRITNVVSHDNLDAGISIYGYPLDSGSPNYAHTNVYIGNSMAYNNIGDSKSNRPSGNGIVVGGVDGAIIERSTAYENGANNTSLEGPVGIWAYDANNVIIQHNESYLNRTNSYGDGDGFDLDVNVTNSIMQYNYSHDNEGAGFLVYADQNRPSSNNIVRFNVSENDGRKLSGYGGIVVGGSVRGIDVYNNTIYVTAATSSPAAIRVIEVGGIPADLSFRNNILYTSKGLDGQAMLIDAPANSSYLFHGNNYFDSSGTFAIRWGGVTYSSLESWLDNNPTQEHVNGIVVGKSVDPMLTAPGGGGTIGDAALLETALTAYKLLPGSPLIGAGLDLGSLFNKNPGQIDFYGDLINQTDAIDIGADAFLALTTAPLTTAAITDVTDSVGLIQGSVEAGASTDDTTPTITGTITAALAVGETLRIFNGPSLLGTATVDNTTRTWRYTPTLPPTSGTSYSITARVADAAGNLGLASEARTFTLDSTDPATTVAITAVTDDVGLIQGAVPSGRRTDDLTPTISGTLSAPLADEEALQIFRGSALLGIASVNSTDQTWTFTPTLAATAGTSYSISARVADAVGNRGSVSNTRTFILDSTAPVTTATIASVTDNFGLLQGIVNSGGRSDDRTPTLTGTLSGPLASGETLRLFNGSTLLGSASVNNTARTWSFTPSLPATSGTTYTISASVADAAGNLGPASDPFTFTLDTTPNLITGTAGDDLLSLTSAADLITGLEGNDTIVLPRLTDSLLGTTTAPTFDRITDLITGFDRIDAPVARTLATAVNPVVLGAVPDLTRKGISTLLTAAIFPALTTTSTAGVASFTFDDPLAGTRTFLAINNSTAGFSARSDAIVEITGFSGNLSQLQVF